MTKLIELYEAAIGRLHDQRPISFNQFQTLEPEAARFQKEYYEKREASIPDITHHKSQPQSAAEILNQFKYKSNPNGSWEAWPPPHSYMGVDVWNPDEKRWGNSGYVDDKWLDSTTGIENWRDNTKEIS